MTMMTSEGDRFFGRRTPKLKKFTHRQRRSAPVEQPTAEISRHAAALGRLAHRKNRIGREKETMTNIHAAVLGKIGRSRNTEVQAVAARENGKKGGRPGRCQHVFANGNRCTRQSIVKWTTCERHRRLGRKRTRR